MGYVDLQGLTVGERLLIYRRRKKFTQEIMASIYKTNRNLYGQIERDEIAIPPSLRMPVPAITELTKIEAALITRRREGLTQEDVSVDLGISRHWLGMKERGDAPNRDLMAHWEIERKQ